MILEQLRQPSNRKELYERKRLQEKADLINPLPIKGTEIEAYHPLLQTIPLFHPDTSSLSASIQLSSPLPSHVQPENQVAQLDKDM
ncbi:MAG: hypothetical protein L6R41_001852 [Letrouitia leprolyta]|nr:MAG: hypothetical protein L6R41_001852 [Letrouitia leprolyta]